MISVRYVAKVSTSFFRCVPGQLFPAMGSCEESSGREENGPFRRPEDVCGIKSVFVTLVDGAYKYNKKKIMGRRENGHYRVQFVCLECAKIGVFLSAYCTVTVEDPDLEEADVYEADKLPTPEQHSCQPHGVEDLVEKFKKALRDGVHENPVRPLPELFETTR